MGQKHNDATVLLHAGILLVVGWACQVGSETVEPPQLLFANFTIEANWVQVVFDRHTLEGAKPIDSDGDTIFDSVDYSKQLKGEFDCSKVFADATSVLLSGPPPATCKWINPSRLRVNLAKGHRVDLGDRITLRENAIYALPSGVAWETEAARGSIRIGEPSPLEPPVVIIKGSTTIDEFAGTQLNGKDSFKIGGSATYLWALAENTTELPNPSDLCGNESRVFDDTKVRLMKDRLSLLTDMNSPVLDVAADLVDPASTLRVMLNVTGRWHLTSSKVVELRRLGKCRFTTTFAPSTSGSTVVDTSGDDEQDNLALVDHSPGISRVPIALTMMLLLTVIVLQSN
jgi:hypothetical protein